MARADRRAREPTREPGGDATDPTIRFDLWLWAARFYRSRSLAAGAIGNGQARLNGERVKQAHAVRAGDRVTVRKAEVEWDVTVTGIAGRRGSAADAATLYRESDASRTAREERAARARDDAASPRHPGRPTKRERRRLEDFLGEP